MRRAGFSFLARTVLRVFYRRWEIVGLENVPETGPCLVLSNHNNSLVDPLVVGCALPRPIRYVAKATLWKRPVVATVLELTNAIPMARPEDRDELIRAGGDSSAINRRGFEELHRALDAGECIGMFPEGFSHAGKDLARLRSGASFVAFAHAEAREFRETLPLLPVGLSWSEARKFRSDVAVVIGRPVDSRPWHELYRKKGRRALIPLNRRLSQAIRSATLLGEHGARRRRVERACDLLEDLNRHEPDRFPLPEGRHGRLTGVRLRRLALDYAEELLRNDPERLKPLAGAIRRLEALERAAGLAPRRRGPLGRRERHYGAFRWAGESLLSLATLPLVVLGAAIWAPIYYLARLFSSFPRGQGPDVKASVKVFSTLFFAPIWFLLVLLGFPVVALATGLPWWVGLAVAALAPFLGLYALHRIEVVSDLVDVGWSILRKRAVRGELARRRAKAAHLLRGELFATR